MHWGLLERKGLENAMAGFLEGGTRVKADARAGDMPVCAQIFSENFRGPAREWLKIFGRVKLFQDIEWKVVSKIHDEPRVIELFFFLSYTFTLQISRVMVR
jgi:hypothetical protein